jgi:DNA helicase HerA-like ATPase
VPDAIQSSSSQRPDARPYAWSLHQFCRERLLGFLFADADNETSQLASVIRSVESVLAAKSIATDPDENGFITIVGAEVTTIRSFDDLVTEIQKNIEGWAQLAAPGSRQAFLRRLEDAKFTAGHLIRAIPPKREAEHSIRILDGANEGENAQVTVIDINDLHDRAKRFVVGVIVRKLVDQKEGRPRPLVFLVLDELNKYAPREGWSPIKEVILDIAERGRSLGVVLIGAQQTASEIERRVTANASFRVAGRLDTAEATRGEYGFLTDAAKARASILKPGSMFLHQPEIPVPLLVQFPFPAWATRQSEVDDSASPPPGLRGKMR